MAKKTKAAGAKPAAKTTPKVSTKPAAKVETEAKVEKTPVVETEAKVEETPVVETEAEIEAKAKEEAEKLAKAKKSKGRPVFEHPNGFNYGFKKDTPTTLRIDGVPRPLKKLITDKEVMLDLIAGNSNFVERIN